MIRPGWLKHALRALFPPVELPDNLAISRQICLARHAIASEQERQAAERLVKLLDACEPPALLS